MIVGIPRETHLHEHRVGLTPYAAQRLIHGGHTVLVEKDAGASAHFSDQRYQSIGAQIVYGPEEIYGRAKMICRIGSVSAGELELLEPGSVLCGFQSLAMAPRDFVEQLMALEVTLIGYEVIEDRDGDLPILLPMSEMAGQMAVQIAAQYLCSEAGGRGILLGKVPGVPPPTVLILGAGEVGRSAARQAQLTGAHVIVVDVDVESLRRIEREFAGTVVTAMAGLDRLERFTAIADVIIGAVLVRGGITPQLVTEEMVRNMKMGSVIIDVAIDQGGCFATSRPTSLSEPVFVAHDVVHYCVPNMTANIARTASRALANAAFPYLQELAGRSSAESLEAYPGLGRGVYLYRGQLVNRRVGKILGIDAVDLGELLERASA